MTSKFFPIPEYDALTFLIPGIDLFFPLLCYMAHGILAPWLGIKPAPPAVEAQVLTTGPPGKSRYWSNLGKRPTLNPMVSNKAVVFSTSHFINWITYIHILSIYELEMCILLQRAKEASFFSTTYHKGKSVRTKLVVMSPYSSNTLNKWDQSMCKI